MLPSIKIMLPLLVVLWCLGAFWAFGGPVMLAYPLMWGAVVGLFFVATKLLGGRSPAGDS